MININKELEKGTSVSKCPACSCEKIKKIGALPEAFHFCSFQYNHPINKGDLYKCLSCNLFFRNPCLTSDILKKLYMEQPKTTWGGDSEEREDFKQIASYINCNIKSAKLNILDIGCFDGGLLNFLKQNCTSGETFTLHGIEPSIDAAQTARHSGINIIGSDVRELYKSEKRYHLILLVDVFEHIFDIKTELNYLKEKLLPSGFIIIVTGALDSKSFNKYKNSYYYAAMPEHIVFITRKHAVWLSTAIGLKLDRYTYISHILRHHYLISILKKLLKSIIFIFLSLMPSKFFSGSSNFVRKLVGIRSSGIPNIFNKPDHAIIIFSNND